MSSPDPFAQVTAPHARPLVHHAFASQARRSPGAVAVIYGGQPVTYRELDARVGLLAHRLRALGVGPEARVGVCLERSVELVVALLAVLRAGGAYVPLDPGYPAARLAYMLADARVPVLLTRPELRDRLPGFAGEVVEVDGREAPTPDPSPDAGGGEHGGVDAVAGCSLSLAYVVYTSGSTGHPKGVMVSHGALASHMAWMQRVFPLEPGDRVLQRTPLSFDASVWEFWAPLTAGATLVLAGPGAHRDPAELLRTVAEERITVLQVVPALLGALLEAGGLERCTALRRLFCGGEALPAGLAARARAVSGAEVVNLYGPTEACIDATYAVADGTATGATVPIGRAVDGVQARVLDAEGAPVAEGTPGELYLGGVQLARGYLGRPELTAERWLPDPLHGAGERMYRTGDLARWLPDGELDFLGRVDQQVKIRGFRIEPGEVEAVLRGHPGVREAAVLAREDGPGGRRLVGYVVPAGDPGTPAAELRAWLKERLPEHMVPSAFVVLEAFPLTPSGKLDRRALPAPETDSGPAGGYVAPRDPLEEGMAKIWEEVLGRSPVGIHDNFFDLGGHSLLVMQVVSRVRGAFDAELPVAAVFEKPTVAELAPLLTGQGARPRRTSPIQRADRRGRVLRE